MEEFAATGRAACMSRRPALVAEALEMGSKDSTADAVLRAFGQYLFDERALASLTVGS